MGASELQVKLGGTFMQAKDLMTKSVECVSPDMRVDEIAKTMKSMDIGFVPVCQNDRLVGTVTDRDIVLRGLADGKDMKDCKAGDIMTPEVFWCYEDQTAEEVGDYMSKKEIRRVVVIGRDKRIAGVISIGDLAKRGEQSKAGETICNIAEAPPARAA
jgi:CBS domain-containing protein